MSALHGCLSFWLFSTAKAIITVNILQITIMKANNKSTTAKKKNENGKVFVLL